MTLIFDQYVASMGKGISITESRKNCQLNIDLLYPAGFQYSIFSADYRGYVALDKGVNGTQKSIYYFSGQTAQVCSSVVDQVSFSQSNWIFQSSTSTNFVGPVSKDYLIHDEATSVSAVLSPCGAEGMLNINSQVRLAGATGLNGLMTTDSVDTKFTQILYLNWQKC